MQDPHSSSAGKFRPNSARGVKIHGLLKGDFALQLGRKILALHGESEAPVTLYIRSTGGSVNSYKRLMETISTGGPAGRPRPIVAVAKGRVESVAAFLTVQSNFAYADPLAKFKFHGVRYQLARPLPVLRLESIKKMAFQLQSENQLIAHKMAKRIAPRLAQRQGNLSRLAHASSGSSALRRNFIDLLLSRITSAKARALLVAAHASTKLFFSAAVPARLGNPAVPISHPWSSQVQILGTLAGQRLRTEAHAGQQVNDAFFFGVAADFAFFQAAQTFIHADLASSDGRTPASTSRRNDRRSQKLNCLALAIATHLLQGENSLDPADAYWLGLIDEVLGTDLV